VPTETTPPVATLAQSYEARTSRSRRLHARAAGIFPNGATHVGRYLRPYPLYVERAAGSHKWDVDGNEYVDYFGGHGALLLGHCHPEVQSAVERQIALGNHFGAEHEGAVVWAELIQEMVPGAERVRFTSSGTEATQLALRMARARTGRSKIVRFGGHFHGWHDHLAFSAPVSEANQPAGIPAGVVGEVIVVPPNDVAALETLLGERDDVAAVILEPTGAGFGRVPTGRATLLALREMTSRRGVPLIFDEVITGFRVSPGGAQEHYGIRPDLTTLAKIIAGGYNGAAVVGRAEFFEALAFQELDGVAKAPAIPHQGTFNGSPLAAAAGIATLRLLRDGSLIARANRSAETIRHEMNVELKRRGRGWCAYGEFSAFHLLPVDAAAEGPEDVYSGKVPWQVLKSSTPEPLSHSFRLGFICEGVDITGWPGGMVSAVHDEDDLERTLTAFRRTLDELERADR
jgi:glutamate-1-semialdehyde 2,1-aminomutase